MQKKRAIIERVRLAGIPFFPAQNAGTNCAATTVNGKTEYRGNSYAYDAWGNLLNKTVTKCGAESLTVTADAHNWIHAPAPDYLYDAAGNMTFNATPPTQTYSYDQENRLTGAAGYTYTYDGDGNRVRKSNGNLAANGTLYWEMSPGVVAETDLAGTLKSEYMFFDGERVARRDGVNGVGGVFYYFSDHLKTASVITDSAGVIKAESDYYPWGGELQFVNNDSNDYKFTGKKRDSETQLDYFGARYYSNGLGRFMSPDSISNDWELRNPQTWNRYAYARNSPLVYIDPDGRAVELLGDKEKRDAELAILQKDVGNKEAASKVYINEVKDGDKTRYFVGIKGDLGDFKNLSATSADLGNLFDSTVEWRFALCLQQNLYGGVGSG
jgi:RHS repeat-associated protein